MKKGVVMESYSNTSLVHADSFLKLKIRHLSCGTFTGKWNCTLSFNRLIYIFEGSRVPSTIDVQGETFRMEPGNWLFIPAGFRSSHEQYEGVYLISLQFNLELISGIEYMTGCSGPYMGKAPERKEEFYSLMDPQAELPDVFMLQKLIWDFVQPIAGKEKENLQDQPDSLSVFQPLCDAFFQAPYQDFSVDDMAKIMKMGKESFVKQFTVRTGIPPKLFFHRIRSAAAAEELLKSDAPIREIAERFHFSDEFYFSRFMKRMTGLSPREYRKRMSFQQK